MLAAVTKDGRRLLPSVREVVLWLDRRVALSSTDQVDITEAVYRTFEESGSAKRSHG